MAERTHKNSNGCWPRWSDQVIFQLAYIRATAERQSADSRRTLEIATAILATLQATAPPKTPSGQPTLLRQIRDWADGIETLNRLWQLYRKVREWPLGIIGWGLVAFLTWLGVF